MIVTRKTKPKNTAHFGFLDIMLNAPSKRYQKIEKGAKYNQKVLQAALDQAKREGKNLRDPTVLKAVMTPIADKMGRNSGGTYYNRRRRTKRGLVIERVRKRRQ